MISYYGALTANDSINIVLYLTKIAHCSESAKETSKKHIESVIYGKRRPKQLKPTLSLTKNQIFYTKKINP